jgi:dGTPase
VALWTEFLSIPGYTGAIPTQLDKWGAYETERGLFDWARIGHRWGSRTKCVVAELMDWADDITYAVHDLIDFYRAGQIPLDRLADRKHASERKVFFDKVFSRRTDLIARRTELEKRFQGVLEFFPVDRRYEGSLQQRQTLWQSTTVLISQYAGAIRLANPTTADDSAIILESNARDEILMLKELTWHYVILKNDLASLPARSATDCAHCFSHDAASGAGQKTVESLSAGISRGTGWRGWQF